MRGRCTVRRVSCHRKMAFGRNREGGEEGLSPFKFWLLFVVGLVILLSLFRGFTGKAEMEGSQSEKAERKGKRRGRKGKKKEGGAEGKPHLHEHQD